LPTAEAVKTENSVIAALPPLATVELYCSSDIFSVFSVLSYRYRDLNL
jgi:hypothetical protein